MGSTILLADKSVTIQKIVELTFAEDAYVIKCFSDGEAALGAIPQLRPDLILADISLPLKSGYDVCQAVRTDPQYSDFAAVPVLLLAGIYETMDEDRARHVEERANEVGASEVLSKPFDPQVLTAKVKHFLEKPQTLEDSVPTVIEEAERPTEPNIFTGTFKLPLATASNFEEAPEDDSERTMMLPRAPFSENLFAATPSFPEPQKLEPVAEQTRPPVNVEAFSPAYEPVFDESKDFSEQENIINYSDANTDPLIRQEEDLRTEEPPTIIVPTTEEPFSDVFEEQAVQAQWTSGSTEEESPFGMPEPIVAPPIAEPEMPVVAGQEMEPEASAISSEVLSFEEPALLVEELPLPSIEQPLVAEEVVSATAEDSYDDTWPGVILNSGQPVEELFEAESTPAIQDLVVEEPASTGSRMEEVATPVAASENGRPFQITDELVDKIAERVVTKLSERLVSEIVWQVVPDLAEKMIRRELEKLHAGEE